MPAQVIALNAFELAILILCELLDAAAWLRAPVTTGTARIPIASQNESVAEVVSTETESLLTLLRSFYFPEGEDSARLIREIATAETGSLQVSLGARATPFTAAQRTDCTRSSFVWEAHLNPGKVNSATVVDAYEDGHGRIAVKAIGVIPVKKFTGREVDVGELQRYLASIVLCPVALLNHTSLELQAAGPFTLRLCDRKDSTGAFVDLDLSKDGVPIGCRAQRPRLAGKQCVLTPWSTCGSEFRVFEGLRFPTRLEARWDFPDPFIYYRSQITSFHCVR